MKVAGGERSPHAGPASPPAHLMHAGLSHPRSSRVTVQVPVNASLRSGPHAAAEGGAPGLLRAERCLPGTPGKKTAIGEVATEPQNHRTTEG